MDSRETVRRASPLEPWYPDFPPPVIIGLLTLWERIIDVRQEEIQKLARFARDNLTRALSIYVRATGKGDTTFTTMTETEKQTDDMWGSRICGRFAHVDD